MEWIKTLDLNLSPQKIEGIARKISNDYERKGVIHFTNRTDAISFLEECGIGADVLNTHGTEGDKTRVLRLLVQVMENFNANQSTLSVALFDSQASTHADLDSRRKNTINLLTELDKTIMTYASTRVSNVNTPAWEVLGAIPQKVGVESRDRGLVEV